MAANIVRGGARDVVEGDWLAGRIVVLEFPDWDSANGFAGAPAYEQIATIRHASTTSHIWIVEGAEGGANADDKHAYILGQIHMTDPDRYAPYAAKVPDVLGAARGT